MSLATFNRAGAQGGDGEGGSQLGLSYSRFLKVGYVNVNKLANKIEHVGYLLKDNDMDILGIGESWLTESVTDSFVELSGYKIERKDDPSNISKHGVAIYIRNSIKYEVIKCNCKNVLIIKLIDQMLYIFRNWYYIWNIKSLFFFIFF